nr:MAG TPA: hypothetical protein [Caudoviricetes sp.]
MQLVKNMPYDYFGQFDRNTRSRKDFGHHTSRYQ